MCFTMMLQDMTNFFSKLNVKCFPNFDLIIFSLFVSFALYVLYQYIWSQIQRFMFYHNLIYLNAGNEIYNRECCPICLLEFKAPARANCGHAFCMDCLLHYFKRNNNHWKCICPLCRSCIRDFDCLHKFDFDKKEKTTIKKMENQLRKLITKQNSQIKFVQRFIWICTNKWKTFIGITITIIALIGAFIHQFF